MVINKIWKSHRAIGGKWYLGTMKHTMKNLHSCCISPSGRHPNHDVLLSSRKGTMEKAKEGLGILL